MARGVETKRPAKNPGDYALNRKYLIKKVLSDKGMANVYLAEDINLNKTWVIKEVFKSPGALESKENLEYRAFLNEARLLSTLNNNSIPRIVERGVEGGAQVIAMDFIEGQTFDLMLQERGEPFSEKTAVSYMTQVCQILGYLHGLANPILYRDLKPGNIIVSNGHVKLIDFGISKQVTFQGETYGEALGTPGYAAPEQAKKDNAITLSSDIYGVGAVLFKLLTGIDPTHWTANLKSTLLTEAKALRAAGKEDEAVAKENQFKRGFHRILDPRKASRHNSMVSAGLAEIVIKCTQPLETRYRLIEEVLYDLKNYADKDANFKQKARRKVRTTKALALAGVGVILLSAVPLYLQGTQDNSEYENAVQVAEQSGRVEDYSAAISLRPDDLDPYSGLIESIKSDGSFTKEEELSLLNLVNPNLTKIQAQEGYGDLAYELGKLYWFYYDGGQSLSVKWFQAASDSGVSAVDVPIYLSIGEFQRTIQGAIQESSDSGMYKGYWDQLLSAEALEGGELVHLQVLITMSEAIDSYSYNLYKDGVQQDQVMAAIDRIDARITQPASPGKPEELLTQLKEKSQGLREKVELGYAGVNS